MVGFCNFVTQFGINVRTGSGFRIEMSALLIRLLYTLYFLPLSDNIHFSTSINVSSSRSVSFLYTELRGIFNLAESSAAVFPFLIIENKIARDSESAKASITF